MPIGTLDLRFDDLAFATAFSETIRLIYDAALTPEIWPAALSRVGALFDAEGAAIVFYRNNSPTEFIHAPDLKPAVDIYVAEEWWRHDLHAHRAIERSLIAGDVLSDRTIATPTEIETHPIYREFFARVGFGWIMSCILLPEKDSLVAISLPRAKAKGAYTESETHFLQLVGRHVEQSLRLSLRLGELEASASVLRAAMNAIDAQIFALDAMRGLVMANSTSTERFEECFARVGGRVVARSLAERKAFDDLVASAEANVQGQSRPRPCLLTGTDGRRTAVWAMPLTKEAHHRIGLTEPAHVLLIATQIESDRRIDPSVIRDIFQLSLGEARIASLVGTGVTVREAAKTLGITEGTARLVLKQVFRKLGINRQTELALRIAAISRDLPCGK